MNITIMRKRWNLRFVPLKKVLGDCDSPREKRKQIRIDSRLRGSRLLRVLIHELLHAADWSESEESIDEKSICLSRILWRLGYRKTDERDNNE